MANDINGDEWMKSIKGFLLDITGVLYNSSPYGGSVIPGSVEAVKRLYKERKLRFLSNESTSIRPKLVEKLKKLGYELSEADIITPAPVAAKFIKVNKLRPYLLVHKGIMPEFRDCDQSDLKNCVVIGDAEENFSYENINHAFRLLNKVENSLIVSLGCGRFYQRIDGPCLNLGGFAMALKYATNRALKIIGKPEEEYFMSAVNDMGLKKEEVVMIGDDIISDVSGAQKIGIRAVQVRTGKWRTEWENHTIKPDFIANDLNHAVETILNKI